MGARDTIAKLLMGKVGGPWEGGIRAYHSSPHDFDKFDWSKLRTGEGANTYGAGFYAAENPKVSGQGGEYWQQFAPRFGMHEDEAAQALKYTGFDRDKAIELLRKRAERQGNVETMIGPQSLTNMVDQSYADQTRKAIKLLESGAPVGPRTYEVNINARPELLLDWDKPLSSQSPGVRSTLLSMGVPDKPQVTGSMAYWDLGGQALIRGKPSRDVPEYASKALAEAGIPGIRYLDQGSRPTGGGMTSAGMTLAEPRKTYNYVVTDPSKLDIMAKYGIVGGAPVGMGALAAQDQYGTQP
jgi:hypothetical protein